MTHIVGVAVSATNADLANSAAISACAHSRPAAKPHDRRVLTKIDIMDEGTNALDVLEGAVIPLRRDWVGVGKPQPKKTINEVGGIGAAFNVATPATTVIAIHDVCTTIGSLASRVVVGGFGFAVLFSTPSATNTTVDMSVYTLSVSSIDASLVMGGAGIASFLSVLYSELALFVLNATATVRHISNGGGYVVVGGYGFALNFLASNANAGSFIVNATNVTVAVVTNASTANANFFVGGIGVGGTAQGAVPSASVSVSVTGAVVSITVGTVCSYCLVGVGVANIGRTWYVLATDVTVETNVLDATSTSTLAVIIGAVAISAGSANVTAADVVVSRCFVTGLAGSHSVAIGYVVLPPLSARLALRVVDSNVTAGRNGGAVGAVAPAATPALTVDASVVTCTLWACGSSALLKSASGYASIRNSDIYGALGP